MAFQGQQAQRRAALIGGIVGGVLGLLVLETVGQIVIMAAIGGVIGYVVPEVAQAIRSGAWGTAPGRGSASPAYRKLLRMTMGDREQAERLIRYERRYAPDASREQLIQRAIDRLEYDRR